MAARRINLLPPELAERRRSRQRVAGTAVAALALVAALGVVYGAQEIRLHGERSKLNAQRARNAALRGDLADLAEFDRLQSELQRKTGLLDDLTQREIRWSVLLADVSLVIPSDVWLTSLTGSVSGSAVAGDPLGTIQMNGTTFSHIDVAKWLVRLADVEEFTFPYLTLSSKGTQEDTPVVNFNSSVQISDGALRGNQPGARRQL
ncbi:MAG: PilN domain-containing protein [Actinomycetota bacterium]